MTYQTVTIKDARDKFSELIERAAIGGELFVVTKFGKHKAIISPTSFISLNLSADKQKKEILSKTKGLWKKRKDIQDGASWVKNLRQQQNKRYGKIFG